MKLGQKQKSAKERREITRKAIEIQAGYHPDTTISELAREHGISRQSIYDYLDWALGDPEGRLKEAQEELEFRREVFKLVRGRANRSSRVPAP